jgi:hypothetical protein
MQVYRIYGLRLCADLPIPGLAPLASPEFDIQVNLRSVPPWLDQVPRGSKEPFYVSPHLNQRGDPALQVWALGKGAFFRLVYGEGVEFVVDMPGTVIWAQWRDHVSVLDAAWYLCGPVLGYVLHLRGVTCLHASAVAVDGRVIILAGMAGAGKSTAAAAFAQQGFPVLSDDIVALHEQGDQFWAAPGYPRVCLWPTSVRALYGSEDALPHIAPPWTKRYLDLTAGNKFQPDPLPLGAVYILTERADDPSAPFCSASHPLADLMSLVENSYGGYLLTNGMKARDFGFLGRLVQKVPVRSLIPHADSTRLTQLCDTILKDYQDLISGPARTG